MTSTEIIALTGADRMAVAGAIRTLCRQGFLRAVYQFEDKASLGGKNVTVYKKTAREN